MKIFASIGAIVLILMLTFSLHKVTEEITIVQNEVEQLKKEIESNEKQLEFYEKLVKAKDINIMEKSKRISDLEVETLKKKEVKVTAYTPSKAECGNTKGVGAFGDKLKFGHVAVSRPLYQKGWTEGKRVLLKDMGIFTIADKMGSEKKEAIDIFMPTKRQVAFNFGKQMTEAILLD